MARTPHSAAPGGAFHAPSDRMVGMKFKWPDNSQWPVWLLLIAAYLCGSSGHGRQSVFLCMLASGGRVGAMAAARPQNGTVENSNDLDWG